ncbi:MAG: hypothetical protein OXR62_13160 [Ahrensia sp.]|nr:hypothetical protein [Ahrensia sp.]
MKTVVALFFASLASLIVAKASAALIDPLIRFPSFPQCHDAKVLKQVIKRFNWAEDETWKRGFHLTEIRRARERTVLGESDFAERHVTDDYFDTPMSERLIPRRYCRGHAILTNGKHPTLFYLIEGGQGLAGTSYNVEFCLAGYDRWREFDGSCRAINY